MAHVQANIAAFGAKLNEFRANEKYCDLHIQVGGALFKGHRVVFAAATEYFDVMFDEQPQESTVTLNEAIDAHTFEEVVLNFVYTGDVTINRFNVVNVLRTSVIFKLANVEERCIEFIRKNSKISKILNLFVSDVQPKKNSWISVLSRYIMEHFDEFCDSELLMEFSFDNFKALLCDRWFLSPNNEYLLLDTVIKWFHRCEEERREYFNYLIDHMNFLNISADYMKRLLKKFCLKTSSSISRTNNASSNKNNSSPSEQRADDDDIKYIIRPRSGLHMYIADEGQKIRVYSTDKTTLYWSASSVKDIELHHSSGHSNHHTYSIASLGLDDRIYSLEYHSMTKNTFNARTHVVFSSTVQSLKPPPVRMDSFDMCSIQKNIYVNNSCCSEDFIVQNDVHNYGTGGGSNDDAFTNEEIGQGIFAYDIDVDKWLPLPLLDGKLDGSAVTSYNNILYLIEGTKKVHPTDDGANVIIRALDYRTSKWQKLIKKFSANDSDGCTARTMLGCAHEGKIYVCPAFGQPKNPAAVKIYDLRIQKWEKTVPMNGNYEIYQLLSYENYVWAFGRSEKNDLLDVEVFNAGRQEWSSSPISKMNCVTEDGSKNFFFKNAFIFKSLS